MIRLGYVILAGVIFPLIVKWLSTNVHIGAG